MKNNTKTLWIVIILLGVLNITTIATIIYHNHQKKGESENIVFEPNAQPLNGRYFRQALSFNNEQMAIFKSSSQTFRHDANRIISSINTQKEMLFAEIQAEHPDTTKIKQINIEIGSLHTALKDATVTFYLSLNEICNTEQRKNLQVIFTPLFKCSKNPSFRAADVETEN